MSSNHNVEALSHAANAHKRAGLQRVLQAQSARLRRRRWARVGAAAAGGAAALLTVAAIWRPGIAPAPGESRPAVVLAAPAPRAPTAAPPTAAGPEIVIVRTDELLADSARVGDAQLRSLLVEAGEPVGVLRVGGRSITERDLLIAATGATAAGP